MTLQQNYIGCDISKATIDFVDISTNTHQQIANSRPAITRFLKPFKGRDIGFAFEATGYYGLELQRCLGRAGLDAIQINPLHARRFAQSRGRLAKTDKIDAGQLAEMAKRFNLPPTSVFCEKTQELKSLIKRRDQLVDQRADERKRLQQTSLKPIIASLKRAIERLTKEIEIFDDLILQTVQNYPQFAQKSQLLQTVPGISKAGAPVLIAMLGEAGHVNRRQIAALAGVAPFNRDSGTMNAKRSIAGGRKRIRRTLYMAALAAIRSKSKLGEKYRQLRANGKPPKVALIAIARKIVTIINAMLKTNTAYQ